LLPKIKGAKVPGTYLKPSQFFSVTKSSANKEEAVKFVDYFVNDIEANRVLLAERGVPIAPKVREDLKGVIDSIAMRSVFEFIDLVGNGNASPIDPPDPAGAGEVIKLFRTIDQEVLYGTASPQDAAARFIKEATEILVKANKK
jgi:multiple sugar transport system substrate-binding protein